MSTPTLKTENLVQLQVALRSIEFDCFHLSTSRSILRISLRSGILGLYLLSSFGGGSDIIIRSSLQRRPNWNNIANTRYGSVN